MIKNEIEYELNENRMVKSKLELEFIRTACRISTNAFMKVMKSSKPGIIMIQ